MDEQELQGRMNGIALALEVALKEAFSLRYGETPEAADMAAARIRELIDIFRKDGPENFFETGTRESLELIAGRLEKMYGTPNKQRH